MLSHDHGSLDGKNHLVGVLWVLIKERSKEMQRRVGVLWWTVERRRVDHVDPAVHRCSVTPQHSIPETGEDASRSRG